MNRKEDIPQATDIVIAGGGPAGCCAALRLLKMGYRVVLLEAAHFPRFQIGEVLTPGALSILDLLKCTGVLDVAHCTKCPPSRIAWETQVSAVFRSGGYLADRAQMDYALLQESVDRGAVLLQPARYISCSCHPAYSEVTFSYRNTTRHIRCRFLLDAGGRNRHNHRQSVYLAPDTIAVWNQTECGQPAPGEVLMEAVDEGWLWHAPTATGTEDRLVAVLSPATLKKTGIRGVYSA